MLIKYGMLKIKVFGENLMEKSKSYSIYGEDSISLQLLHIQNILNQQVVQVNHYGENMRLMKLNIVQNLLIWKK